MNLHTGPSRHTHVWTPRNQQDVPIDKSQVLVAEYATRRDGLRPRMHGMSAKQNQHATNESTVITHIS